MSRQAECYRLGKRCLILVRCIHEPHILKGCFKPKKNLSQHQGRGNKIKQYHLQKKKIESSSHQNYTHSYPVFQRYVFVIAFILLGVGLSSSVQWPLSELLGKPVAPFNALNIHVPCAAVQNRDVQESSTLLKEVSESQAVLESQCGTLHLYPLSLSYHSQSQYFLIFCC